MRCVARSADLRTCLQAHNRASLSSVKIGVQMSFCQRSALHYGAGNRRRDVCKSICAMREAGEAIYEPPHSEETREKDRRQGQKGTFWGKSMEHGHPLARLAAFVAAARMRGRPTRIVVRNTERFGLIHLYFQHGHLVRVEGYRDTPFTGLADLATWQYGVLRQDEVSGDYGEGPVDPRLETAFADTLRELEARGVVQPAPPIAQRAASSGSIPAMPEVIGMMPGVSGMRRSASSINSIPAYQSPSAPTDLPPLDATPDIAVPHGSTAPTATAPEEERLTDPQWQLIALVVRQIMEKAGVLIGAQMAQTILQQSLTHATRSKSPLIDIELDATGWLRATSPNVLTRYTAYDMADAIAALLTGFEARCASLIGTERAQQVITAAAAPFRTSLVQIGLDIAG